MKIITGLFMAWGNFLSLPCPVKKWDNDLKNYMLGFLPTIGMIIGVVWAGLCVAMVWLGRDCKETSWRHERRHRRLCHNLGRVFRYLRYAYSLRRNL